LRGGIREKGFSRRDKTFGKGDYCIKGGDYWKEKVYFGEKDKRKGEKTGQRDRVYKRGKEREKGVCRKEGIRGGGLVWGKSRQTESGGPKIKKGRRGISRGVSVGKGLGGGATDPTTLRGGGKGTTTEKSGFTMKEKKDFSMGERKQG